MKTSACVAWSLIVVVLVFAARSVSAAGCCGNEDSKAAPKAEGETIAQKICPVMGNAINPKIFVDYKGRRIYFCCGMCPDKFKADPEKYVRVVDDQLKAAKGANPRDPAAEGHEGHSH
jgi:YHS domain-containing protein